MYYMEVLLPRLLNQSHYWTTRNPDEADFFLIPHLSTCRYHECVFNRNLPADDCKAQVNQLMLKQLAAISHQHPYWNASNGMDHLVVLAWDQASEVFGWASETRRLLQSTIQLTNLGYMTRHDNFDPFKDITLPSYINMSDALQWQQRRDQLGTTAPTRKILAYFRGTVHEDQRYSHGVRQYLLKRFANHSNFYIQPDHALPTVYYAELHSSTFCLCPGGWSPWSPRFIECITFGSIPVVIADGLRLPFEGLIPYRDFTLRILQKDLPRLNDILERVSQNATWMETARSQMKHYRKALIWNDDIDLDDAHAMHPFNMLMVHFMARLLTTRTLKPHHYIHNQ